MKSAMVATRQDEKLGGDPGQVVRTYTASIRRKGYLFLTLFLLLVLLGFGAVILVHEFGHFIAAKLAGIKVEAFSLFMPPILLGLRRTEDGFRLRILPEVLPKEGDESGDGALSFTFGRKGRASETEYRVGLIPFGGFVKMLGQEDTGPVKTSDDPRSFANKPTGTRAGVLAAGVVFNVISAVSDLASSALL